MKLFSIVTRPFYNLVFAKEQQHHISFFSFLIVLLPIALITGPALPDIIISLIGIYFLIISLLKKLSKYYKNYIVGFFFLFSLYSILRSLYSEFPLESFTNEGSVFYFRYIFFILGFWYLLDNNKYISKCLLIMIICCGSVVILDGFYQYFNGVNIFGNEKWSEHRLTGFFGNEPIIGRYIAYLAIIAFLIIYQIYDFSKLTTILSICLLVVAEIFVFFSGERAPLFYLSFFSFLILIFIPKFKLYRLIGFAVSLLIILFIIQLNPKAKERMIDTTIEQVSSTAVPVLPYSELHERHYVSALKMFEKYPFFGVGTNLFRYKCNKFVFQYKPGSCTSHPHNFYIQILSELGVMGFMFLFSFFVYFLFIVTKQFFYLIFKNNKKLISFRSLLPILSLLIFWWPLIPHMSFYNNWNNIFLMIPLAYYFKLSSDKKE